MISIYIGLSLIVVLGAAAIFVARRPSDEEDAIENIPDPKAFREERRERWGDMAAWEDSDV